MEDAFLPIIPIKFNRGGMDCTANKSAQPLNQEWFMNFILKHRVFMFLLIQILIFASVYQFFPSWITTLVAAILAGILRTNPWSWWKTPLAHVLGLVLGATHDHLWNVAEVVASIVGMPYPSLYIATVVVITTLVVSLTSHAVWLWMPHRKEKES